MTDMSHAGDARAEDEEIDRLVARGLRAELSADDAARLDALTAASPERSARVDGLIRTWTLAGVANPAQASISNPRSPSRRALMAGGVAAGVGAVAASAVLWRGRISPAIYQAPDTGPLRAILADGTRIVLSRGGRMEAVLDGRRRDVRLLSGEAFYAVAKDARRPFRVTVGDHQLTVLGTRFNVDPDPSGLRVALLEGSLRVEQTGEAAEPAVVLKPGLQYWAGHAPRVGPVDAAAAAAWTDGRLVFDDEALSQIAVDIHRQTGRTLMFADPQSAAMRFSGVLRLDNASDWKLALETVLPVRLSPVSGGYRISRR